MFWESFFYDKKSLCHIFFTETAKEKKKAEQELKKINNKRESDCWMKWKLKTQMRRMKLWNQSDRKSVWKFTKKTDKLIWDEKREID